MAAPIPPVVQYMILCDDVLPDPQRPGKLMIVGLTTLLRWPEGSTIPLRLEKLVVLLILSDGRGTGTAEIVCINEETGKQLFGSGARPLSFEGKDPSLPYGVTFKVLNCRFPDPGVYSVQFHFDGQVLSKQTIIVR